jgi:hypothetical protein
VRRETSRVSFLMCPFCVRVLLPSRTTPCYGAASPDRLTLQLGLGHAHGLAGRSTRRRRASVAAGCQSRSRRPAITARTRGATGASGFSAERQFRKIIGYRDLATLVIAIERDHDRRRGAHTDQGGRYRPHRLTVTPGPPPKIHGARDIVLVFYGR